jgi:zinc/manganese transport system permease protein
MSSLRSQGSAARVARRALLRPVPQALGKARPLFDDFMINTWIAATLVAGVAGVVGFFVVIRGASFAAHALPLSAFPGAAAANLLGIDPLIGLLAFSGLGVTGISQLARRARNDLATALSLVMLLGLGALFLSRTTEYFQAVYALLFGEVLGVGTTELGPLAVLSTASVALIVVLFRPLLLDSVSPELGEARGVSARTMELLFLATVALATAMALPVVGALLVFSLMVGPASAARALTARPFVAVLLSAALSIVTVWASIALSFVSDWPIGFFVGGLSALAYTATRASGAVESRR